MSTSLQFSAKEMKGTYAEVGQTNPIRWQLFYREGDVLDVQTCLFKCKDFLNEVVGYYYGQPLDIYGFKTTAMKFNEEGVYTKLSNVFPEFLTNYQQFLKPITDKDGLPELLFVPVGNKEYLTLIPREYFKSTYTISIVSLLLRCLNQPVSISNLEELRKANPSEGLIQPNYYKRSSVDSVLPPEPTRNCWFYGGKQNNSETNKKPNSIHNNGWYGWTTALTQGI